MQSNRSQIIYKYNVGEVIMLPETRIGVIEKIILTDTTQISREGESNGQEVIYEIMNSSRLLGQIPESEVNLYERFKGRNFKYDIKEGDIILVGGKGYVVGKVESSMPANNVLDSEGVGTLDSKASFLKQYTIEALPLTETGEYNPEARPYIFVQTEPLQVTGKMKKETQIHFEKIAQY